MCTEESHFESMVHKYFIIMWYVVFLSFLICLYVGSGFIDDTSSTGSGGPELFDKKSWELNYKEAAIYLQEGEDNLKFDTHPKNQDALPAYILVHNFWFDIMDLFAAVLIMMLAIFEHPAVPLFELEESVSDSKCSICISDFMQTTFFYLWRN